MYIFRYKVSEGNNIKGLNKEGNKESCVEGSKLELEHSCKNNSQIQRIWSRQRIQERKREKDTKREKGEGERERKAKKKGH